MMVYSLHAAIAMRLRRDGYRDGTDVKGAKAGGMCAYNAARSIGTSRVRFCVADEMLNDFQVGWKMEK